MRVVLLDSELPRRVCRTIASLRIVRDESGEITSSAYVLLVTILVVGGVTGLASVRDQIVQELGDAAVALQTLDQSYSFTLLDGDGMPLPNGERVYFDEPDPLQVDLEDQPPGTIELNVPAQAESNSPGPVPPGLSEQ